MRHRVFGRKLNCDYDRRRGLFKNLTRSFFLNNGSIETTLSKAKAVQRMVDGAIREMVKGDLNARRQLFVIFQDQKRVNQLVKNYSKVIGARSGGYTRIIKLNKRKGDNVTIAKLELVVAMEKIVQEGETKGETNKKTEPKTKKEVVTKSRKKKSENLSTKGKTN